MCPLNGHCDTVINSEFSRFFGIPVELMGMAYYAMVAMAYGIFLIVPLAANPLLTIGAFIATTLAFLFSGYLIFIQLFFIRQLCTWCLFSASLCTVIFSASVFTTGGTALLLLTPYVDYILSIYTLGLALGLGSATFSVIFLGKFLRDLHLSTIEAELIRIISQVTWTALAILFVTGSIAYILPMSQQGQPVFSPVQIIVLLVMMGVGALLDLLVMPRLMQISLQQDRTQQMGELKFLRRCALGLAAVTLVSWYVGFVLGTIKVTWGLHGTMVVYGVLVLVAVLASQVIEKNLSRPG